MAAQFTNLTPIQERALLPALEGRDVMGTAQKGTGKTLAFLIPLIETMDREPRVPR
ncbi:MAG TPA: DEAD/DEAH box helicase [Candidatus Bathyarchaeia archaeon]|nr:DEAD/DEAH box helicase [Candidatus Bathyarchaeia archaeon]